MKIKIKKPEVVKQPSGNVEDTLTVTDRRAKELVHSDFKEHVLPPAEFPLNCPVVKANLGLTLGRAGQFTTVRIDASVQLPVPGFTGDLVKETQDRAFELANEALEARMEELRELLNNL